MIVVGARFAESVVARYSRLQEFAPLPPRRSTHDATAPHITLFFI